MTKAYNMNDNELEMVTGGGWAEASGITSDPHFWGSIGNLIAAYVKMNEKNMPQNKVLNICCIYKQRLEAWLSHDMATFELTTAELTFLGVNLEGLDKRVNTMLEPHSRIA